MQKTLGLKIIRPDISHIPTLLELGASTFAETFTGLDHYTPELVGMYNRQAFTHERMARDLADPSHFIYLAELDGHAVGYAHLVRREPEPCVNDAEAIYLNRIYFRKNQLGKGLGRYLLDYIEAEAMRLGHSTIWLSVWGLNKRAVEFYLKTGYRQVGEWDWAFEANGRRYVDRDWLFAKALIHQI